MVYHLDCFIDTTLLLSLRQAHRYISVPERPLFYACSAVVFLFVCFFCILSNLLEAARHPHLQYSKFSSTGTRPYLETKMLSLPRICFIFGGCIFQNKVANTRIGEEARFVLVG